MYYPMLEHGSAICCPLAWAAIFAETGPSLDLPTLRELALLVEYAPSIIQQGAQGGDGVHAFFFAERGFHQNIIINEFVETIRDFHDEA